MFYPIPTRCGTDAITSLGDGYTINVSWFQAALSNTHNRIAYHIYFATVKENIFDEGVKFVSIDAALQANIIDLNPGQEYFFAVRPVEYDPNTFDLTLLPIAHDNLRFYPTSILRQDISATDLVIPLINTDNFPATGVILIGIELIQYAAVDHVNNNLVVVGGSSPVAAHFVLQSNNQYYLPAASNVGQGSINNLTIVGVALTETWTIKCIFVRRDGSNNPIAHTAQFEAQGSISGTARNIYGDPIIWTADNNIVANKYFSFSINESSPVFRQGDEFTVQIVGLSPSVGGGRGYNNTPITQHTVSGFDGYTIWNPIITLFTLTESTQFDRIFAGQCRFEFPNYAWTIVDGYHQVTQDLLSSNLIAADASNVSFPMFDFSGFHRTDPVQLLNGTCVGSYINGEFGCIDGYGNFNIIRGVSVQDQNTQRQDVLLSITGRDAVLVRRVQTGITCSCYMPNSEYQDDRCPVCFIAGTLVRAETGYKSIETIKIGEKVLSSDGYYYPVTQVFKTPYNGNLKAITTSTTTSPIFATPEHPFMVLRGNHKHTLKYGCAPKHCIKYIKRGDGIIRKYDVRQLPSGRWHARVSIDENRVAIGTFDSAEEAKYNIDQYKDTNLPKGHQLEWDDAQNITTKDWLVAKYPIEIQDIQEIEIPQIHRKNTRLGKKRAGPDKFILDEEFLWIIGIYLAEGSTSGKSNVNFTLHIKEEDFRNRIINFFTKHGYTHCISRPKEGNGVNIAILSTTLCSWFPKWLGHLCCNKKIPEELMKLPKNKTWAILQGIYDGDGCKRSNEIKQTSQILALQIIELLHRIGEKPLSRQFQGKNLTKKGNPVRLAYSVDWGHETTKNNLRAGRWTFENELLSKVKKVQDIPYDGYVYNLEVAGDHTYVVQNILVHNCYGTKFVQGYQQYFNPRSSNGRIKVRPGPTAENLKMYESGLESEFPLDLWTLTVPTIKTRDVLVLFDQNDNEEFRYEVADVIRNDTILGLDGAQHLKVFRVRKFDVIYQIKVFRNTADFPSVIMTSINFVPGLAPHQHAIVRNEKNPSTWEQLTQISQSHNHTVFFNQQTGLLEVMPVLGHFHDIIF